MLFHSRPLHKRDAITNEVGATPELRWLLRRHVVFASPARQHPFRVLSEPFRGIVLTANQPCLQRKVFDWTLLSAGSRCVLQAKDEHKRCQCSLLSGDIR